MSMCISVLHVTSHIQVVAMETIRQVQETLHRRVDLVQIVGPDGERTAVISTFQQLIRSMYSKRGYIRGYRGYIIEKNEGNALLMRV